jgi:hypothetical protein
MFQTASRPSEFLHSYRGPLFQYQIVKSIDRNKGVLRRWTVFSNGKRSVLPQYLIGKLLWDNLNQSEMMVLLSLPEATLDTTIYLVLKALNNGIKRSDVRDRILKSPFDELRIPTRQQYLSIKGRVNYFFIEEVVTLRKTIPYSGYTKHYKDKGSLNPFDRDEIISENLEPITDVDESILYNYLSVGEFPLFQGEVIYRLEEAKKQKRKNKMIPTK